MCAVKKRSELPFQLPEEWQEIIIKCWSYNPSDRYNGEELYDKVTSLARSTNEVPDSFRNPSYHNSAT